MLTSRWTAVAAFALLLLTGCSSTQWPMSPASLNPGTDGSITIQSEQLASCQASPDASPMVDPAKPLTLIVHGCRSSGSKYGALASVFREQGQQALCFDYDDRDSITRSSAQLAETLKRLVEQVGVRNITVIGHSQGGLVARHALVKGGRLENTLQDYPAQLRLVTVSTPFGGIEAASHCSSTPLAVLSLGLTIPICQLVTGSKWREIPPASRFINEPGELLPAVHSHLKIVTDEAGSCRTRNEAGVCLKSDAVFSLKEQRQKKVDQTNVMEEQAILAGHVEIVGDATRVPHKLIHILQEHKVLASTLPQEQFLSMLEKLYGSD